MKKFKNVFIRFVFLLTKHFSSNKIDWDHPNILVVSTTALGDTLWATPYLSSIKQKYPFCSLSVLTSSIGSQILLNHPVLDALYIFKKPYLLNFFSLFKQLKKKKFQIIILFHASQRLVFSLCYLLRASRIIGSKHINKGLDYLFTDLIDKRDEHELKRRDRLCQCISVYTQDYSLKFFYKNNLAYSIDRLLKKFSIDTTKRLILIHPGAQDFYKCWPTNSYIQLIEQLNKKFSSQIILTGTKKEKQMIDAIHRAVPSTISLCSSLNLFDLAALIDISHLVITNDTGPMHLATALNKHIIALFSPTDPKLCGPYKHYKKACIIAYPKTCLPCIKRKCREPFCLLQIAPGQVIKKIEEIFAYERA